MTLYTALEILSVLSLLAYVILASYEKPLCWPASILGVTIYIFLMWKARIFGEVALNAYYLAIAVYAWAHWLHGGGAKGELPVARTTRREWTAMAVIAVVGIPVLAAILIRFRGNAAYLDSFTTVLSFLATWMTARKYLESWLVWIVADAVYVGLMVSREFPAYAVLYAIYTIIAVFGLWKWLRSYRAQGAPSPRDADPAPA